MHLDTCALAASVGEQLAQIAAMRPEEQLDKLRALREDGHGIAPLVRDPKLVAGLTAVRCKKNGIHVPREGVVRTLEFQSRAGGV